MVSAAASPSPKGLPRPWTLVVFREGRDIFDGTLIQLGVGWDQFEDLRAVRPANPEVVCVSFRKNPSGKSERKSEHSL
jgi:hypothetical protein